MNMKKTIFFKFPSGKKAIILIGLLAFLSNFVYAARSGSTNYNDYLFLYFGNGTSGTDIAGGKGNLLNSVFTYSGDETYINQSGGGSGRWFLNFTQATTSGNLTFESDFISYSTSSFRAFSMVPNTGSTVTDAMCRCGFFGGLFKYNNGDWQTFFSYHLNEWYTLVMTADTTSDKCWYLVINSTGGYMFVNATTSYNTKSSLATLIVSEENTVSKTGHRNASAYIGNGVVNGKPQAAGGDTTPPIISSLNCTSCTEDSTPDQEPYETEDTTPTFNVTTNENADCRIGTTDQNYTAMGASRDCTTTGGASHTCTLTVQDRFISVGENYLYISCKDGSGNEGNLSDHSKSNSGKIRMEIKGASETPGDNAIQIGIEASEIWPCTVYSEQRLSARNLAASQLTGIFDRVAVKDNKRWAINYVSAGESQITGLFNLTPVLYILQLQNQTNETITDQVGKLINSTWP